MSYSIYMISDEKGFSLLQDERVIGKEFVNSFSFDPWWNFAFNIYITNNRVIFVPAIGGVDWKNSKARYINVYSIKDVELKLSSVILRYPNGDNIRITTNFFNKKKLKYAFDVMLKQISKKLNKLHYVNDNINEAQKYIDDYLGGDYIEKKYLSAIDNEIKEIKYREKVIRDFIAGDESKNDTFGDIDFISLEDEMESLYKKVDDVNNAIDQHKYYSGELRSDRERLLNRVDFLKGSIESIDSDTKEVNKEFLYQCASKLDSIKNEVNNGGVELNNLVDIVQNQTAMEIEVKELEEKVKEINEKRAQFVEINRNNEAAIERSTINGIFNPEKFFGEILSIYRVSGSPFAPDQYGNTPLHGYRYSEYSNTPGERIMSDYEFAIWSLAAKKASHTLLIWLEEVPKIKKELRNKLSKAETLGEAEVIKMDLESLEQDNEQLKNLAWKLKNIPQERDVAIKRESSFKEKKNHEYKLRESQLRSQQESERRLRADEERRHRETLDKIDSNSVIGQAKKHPFLTGIAIGALTDKLKDKK